MGLKKIRCRGSVDRTLFTLSTPLTGQFSTLLSLSWLVDDHVDVGSDDDVDAEGVRESLRDVMGVESSRRALGGLDRGGSGEFEAVVMPVIAVVARGGPSGWTVVAVVASSSSSSSIRGGRQSYLRTVL